MSVLRRERPPADGGSIVLATHDPEVSARCDRVLSLAHHLPAHAP